MADSSVPSALIALGGTIIGFAGGFVGQWLLEGRKQQVEKTRKRAEKLEELVITIYDHREWMNGIATNHKKETHPNSPFAKIEAIKQVYFSQFDILVRKMAVTSNSYYNLIKKNSAVLQQLDPSIPAHATIIDEISEAKDSYYKSLGILLDEIRKYSKREFQ
jgi:hypothetical protein